MLTEPILLKKVEMIGQFQEQAETWRVLGGLLVYIQMFKLRGITDAIEIQEQILLHML